MSTNENHIEELDNESRGMPSVNEIGASSGKRGVIVIAIVLVGGLLGGLVYMKAKKNSSAAQSVQPKAFHVSSAVPQRTFSLPPEPLKEAPKLPAAIVQKSVAVPAPQNVVSVQAASPKLPGKLALQSQKKRIDKSSSTMMITGQTSSAASSFQQPNLRQEADGEGALDGLLQPTVSLKRSAESLGDRNFILAKGSFLNCALQTRLDTTVPGMTSCVITRNVYSDNGKVLLVERGSTVSGEYKSNIKQGQARIFVLWNRIKTINGVVINLDSPGTDSLGGAGVTGYVDNHFFERFGAALMLSLVDDIAATLAQNGAGNETNINLDSSGSTANGAIEEVLKNTINIQPTLYKNQGEVVGIYIARDLDFSSVYNVSAE
jgi:type IV secretion system protein VirB10